MLEQCPHWCCLASHTGPPAPSLWRLPPAESVGKTGAWSVECAAKQYHFTIASPTLRRGLYEPTIADTTSKLSRQGHCETTGAGTRPIAIPQKSRTYSRRLYLGTFPPGALRIHRRRHMLETFTSRSLRAYKLRHHLVSRRSLYEPTVDATSSKLYRAVVEWQGIRT
ncbi:hypothetical protein ACOMHN_046257 [Nucella lapillus]